MGGNDLKLAFLIAWLAVSTFIFTALIAPFILPVTTISAITPVCEWKKRYNAECPSCGMTTSFILISEGEFERARLANKAGLPLYAAFVVNEALALFTLIRRRRHFWKHVKRSLKKVEDSNKSEARYVDG